MKKFVKVSLITAAVFLSIGIVFCLIGGIGDGYRHDRWRELYFGEKMESAVNRIGYELYDETDGRWGFLPDLDDDDYAINGGGTGNGQNGRGQRIASEDAREFQIPVKEVTAWELLLGAGEIIIEEKEDESGYIDCFVEGRGNFDYRMEGSTLVMEGFKGRYLNENNDNKLVMMIPKNCRFNEIDIEMGAAAMEVSGLHAVKLDIEVGASVLTLQDSEANELSIDVGVGAAEATGIQAGNVDITVGMGECIFEGSVSGDIEAEAGMGAIEMTLAGSETDYNYEIECGMGGITLDGREYSGFDREKKIDNGAFRSFEITCGVGAITIDFKAGGQ